MSIWAISGRASGSENRSRAERMKGFINITKSRKWCLPEKTSVVILLAIVQEGFWNSKDALILHIESVHIFSKYFVISRLF